MKHALPLLLLLCAPGALVHADNHDDADKSDMDNFKSAHALVRIKFGDADSDGKRCPKHTRLRVKRWFGDADGDHCSGTSRGPKQADAICFSEGGKTVLFKPNPRSVAFEIYQKANAPYPFSECRTDPGNTNRVKCRVVGEGAYGIRTDGCELDPRILINESTR